MSNQTSIQDSIIKKIFETEFIKETKLTSTILFSFIFVAILAKLLFSGISSSDIYGSNGIASIDIMTYTIILISVISIVFLNTIIVSGDNKNITKTFSWDMVILVIYLCWIISINLKHFKRINMRKVPSEYFLYSNLTLWVILGQASFFIIQFILNSDSKITANNENRQLFTRLNFIHYILMFLNFLLILIQQIILDNFSVDII